MILPDCHKFCENHEVRVSNTRTISEYLMTTIVSIITANISITKRITVKSYKSPNLHLLEYECVFIWQ